MSSASVPIDSALQSMIDLAIADLAAHLHIDKSVIMTVSAHAVAWPDKSAGCPKPGMVYPQIPVDGTLIELSANGATYSYHSGGSRTQFLCQKA